MFKPRPLSEEAYDEKRVVLKVALPEAAGFGTKAEEPFEAGALHPARGLLDAPGVEIEGGADADHQGGIQLGKKFGHEAFLLGCAEANPEDVGGGGGNLALEVGALGGVEGTERGFVCSCH